jgi:hypothetical protein
MHKPECKVSATILNGIKLIIHPFNFPFFSNFQESQNDHNHQSDEASHIDDITYYHPKYV